MKKYTILLFLGLLSFTAVISCSNDDKSSGTTEPENLDPVPVVKTNSTKIYMHYMPWFETNESSPDHQWGYHWTMANKNPNNVDANGKREIASYYYPLIGPYHSGDKDVIENHLLLMKYAGVDGVLIDWYGTYNLNDYRSNKENAEQLIDMLDEVGLEYAIVYEDRFLTNIVDAGLAPTTISAAKTDFSYLQNNYFTDANYIKVDGKPLLLDFGPITLTTPAEWTSAFSGLNPKPTFLTLWYESADAGTNASGEYSWVYQDNTHISNFYANKLPTLNVGMGSAYPGFKDFYQEGGGGSAIGWTIEHNNGATLDATLAMAQNANLKYLQLITWNDFGEGTMFEPTVEFGYSYIEKVKAFAGVQNASVSFNDISKLYNLRKQYKSNSGIQTKLNKAFDYFVSMQPQKAVQILNEIE
ncbi:glycoside hydrolase family 71/99-like protein [Flavobacterium sp. NRK1]|uniref:glycoside hydrolase family 71/99-like protein n=1 Tax=Flavobacterium sp. NRK1 TaxID=2954929 RepID=UPI00209268E1|nr:glycoside hydrolase family 71/99-like protein [Flavobacterium sp. NRK1]MCO6149169.1 glycoside hydrolase family 71/99-like protein [Flavobacterium sp. NRK1]